MKKEVLLTDLDNTLFVSKSNREENYVCVEHLDGNEQSFMSKKAIELLREVRQYVEVIPVTTRSILQYKRIEWPDDCEPEYAITTNGGILLHNRGIVPEWITSVCCGVEFVMDIAEIKRLFNIYKRNKRFTSKRIVDDNFLFFALPDDTGIAPIVAEIKAQTYLPVMHSGRKIYVLPKAITKEKVVENLKKKFEINHVFSAGDSEMDMGMLLASNKGYAHKALTQRVNALGFTSIRVQPEDLKSFSEWYLQRILNWGKKYCI